MSRSRHMKRAAGGKTVYAGAGSNVLKDAMEKQDGGDENERKRGGKVEGEGEKAKHRMDKRARGGSVPGRKRGGAIGADRHPLSSAAKIKEVTKGEYAEDSPKD